MQPTENKSIIIIIIIL